MHEFWILFWIHNNVDEDDVDDDDDEPVPKKGRARKSITVAFKEGTCTCIHMMHCSWLF